MTVQTKQFRSDTGFSTVGFSVANGLLQVNDLDANTFITNSIEIAGTSVYLSVNNGAITINNKAGSPGAINNMAIGITTPASAIFTNLTVNNNLTVNSTGNVTFSPTGNVSITPDGSITIDPYLAGSINNITIGAIVPQAGTFTDITVNDSVTVTNDITADTITATTSLTSGAVTVDSLTVNDDMSADNIVVNNAPTLITHATRKDYVDATAAAFAIALGG